MEAFGQLWESTVWLKRLSACRSAVFGATKYISGLRAHAEFLWWGNWKGKDLYNICIHTYSWIGYVDTVCNITLLFVMNFSQRWLVSQYECSVVWCLPPLWTQMVSWYLNTRSLSWNLTCGWRDCASGPAVDFVSILYIWYKTSFNHLNPSILETNCWQL